MRMLNGQWPPMPSATTPVEDLIKRLCSQFTQWLADERALAATTIVDLADEARRFLSWYLGRSNTECLLGLQVADIDAYLQERYISLRRPSRKGVSQRLRCFMRFAHISGNTVPGYVSNWINMFRQLHRLCQLFQARTFHRTVFDTPQRSISWRQASMSL